MRKTGLTEKGIKKKAYNNLMCVRADSSKQLF